MTKSAKLQGGELIINNVLIFPSDNVASLRLDQQDLREIRLWEEGASRLGYERIFVQRRSGDGSAKQDDFVLIYCFGQPWARWGLARQGRSISIWECSDGMQMGLYTCMKSALDDVPSANDALKFSETKRLDHRIKSSNLIAMSLIPGKTVLSGIGLR